MKRMRYMMSARSQGKLYMQRQQARLTEKDNHRWVFAENVNPETEALVRKWLTTRLDGFHCDLQVMYTPHMRLHSAIQAKTHIVFNNTPPPSAMHRNDEFVSVGLQGLNALDAVKAIIKATGLDPHMSVCGRPFCLDDLGGVDDMERGTV